MSFTCILISKNPDNYYFYLKSYFRKSDCAKNVLELRSLMSKTVYDVIIWDADFKKDIPYSFFKMIAADKTVVILFSEVSSFDFKKLINVGVRFCIDKRDDFSLISNTILQICQNCKQLERRRLLLDRFTISEFACEILKVKYFLSNREIEVIKNSLDSNDYGQIASQLYISKGTVKRHLHNIYQKTNTNGRSQLKNFIYKLNSGQNSSFQNFLEMT